MQIFIKSEADAIKHALEMDNRGFTGEAVSLLKQYTERFPNCLKVIFVYSNLLQKFSEEIFNRNTQNVILELERSKRKAHINDFSLTMNSDNFGKAVFLTAQPKSGSTFLANVLAIATGYAYNTFWFLGTLEHDFQLWLPAIMSSRQYNYVAHGHFKPSFVNVKIMQAMELKPIVLVRNIFDILVSMIDFVDGPFFDGTLFPVEYRRWPYQKRAHAIISKYALWYIEFYVGWIKAIKEGEIEGFLTSYEEVMNNKHKTVYDILNFYDIKRTDENAIIAMEANKEKTRFNKGVSGRGLKQLNKTHIDRIIEISTYYPNVDLSFIGL